MLYLLWNAGSYTLSNFANAMFEQGTVGHNSFETAAKAHKILADCIITSSSVSRVAVIEELRLLCNKKEEKSMMEILFSSSSDCSLERLLINACQYARTRVKLFESIFRVLYAALILQQGLSYTYNDDNGPSAMMIERIKEKYVGAKGLQELSYKRLMSKKFGYSQSEKNSLGLFFSSKCYKSRGYSRPVENQGQNRANI